MLRTLIITTAIVLLIIGLFWPIVSKVPLFRLPGDLVIERSGTKIFIPITSMIVISLVLSLLVRFLR